MVTRRTYRVIAFGVTARPRSSSRAQHARAPARAQRRARRARRALARESSPSRLPGAREAPHASPSEHSDAASPVREAPHASPSEHSDAALRCAKRRTLLRASTAMLPSGARSAARFSERAQRCCLSGARSAARSRRSARQAVQPHARKHVELSDFGTSRSRSANKDMTHESWRSCFGTPEGVEPGGRPPQPNA